MSVTIALVNPDVMDSDEMLDGPHDFPEEITETYGYARYGFVGSPTGLVVTKSVDGEETQAVVVVPDEEWQDHASDLFAELAPVIDAAFAEGE